MIVKQTGILHKGRYFQYAMLSVNLKM
ncbi:hypothetical protein ACJIZ3_016426 [Penstemon smallii]|uniref:Uncharacterized protein n=1 Tax=Penstemon smallii TaxID=265156 RepID=A0ABD3RQK8_9LAMI